MEGARRSSGAAFVLSLIPGAGHLYLGLTGEGIAWLAGVVFGYRVVWWVGFGLHFICAVKAAQAAEAVNRKEESGIAARRENASEVAKMLDDAIARRGTGAGAPPAPGDPQPAAAADDPPPRLMRAAYPAPPERLVQALADAMAAEGLLVLGLDRARHRVRGAVDHGGGRSTVIAGQVEGTPAGSRVRLMIDRPPGSPMGPEVDDTALRSLLERTERILSGSATAGAHSPPGVHGQGESLTEDNFIEQLREAWESYEQGWLPEAEWLQRKQSLVRSVTLRRGTRKSDFMSACKPLVEAGVLDPSDLHVLEGSIPS
jgi:hypothetical protein